ncbi:olfactory receptor 2AG2-like [Sigmodon hispidus]
MKGGKQGQIQENAARQWGTPATVSPGATPARKTMNFSEYCNISDWLRLEATVKASVYMVAFSIATSITVVIIAIVSQDLRLRKECLNPLVYGLRNRDLQRKLYPWMRRQKNQQGAGLNKNLVLRSNSRLVRCAS